MSFNTCEREVGKEKKKKNKKLKEYIFQVFVIESSYLLQ